MPEPARDIKTVMEANVDSLMAIPGVVGVAIGATTDGTPCIKIYVLERKDELLRKLPRHLGGYPVRIEESGEIEPMSDAS